MRALGLVRLVMGEDRTGFASSCSFPSLFFKLIVRFLRTWNLMHPMSTKSERLSENYQKFYGQIQRPSPESRSAYIETRAKRKLQGEWQFR